MGKLQEMNEQFEAAKKRFTDEGKEALAGAFKEFFAKHPRAGCIRWEQYTPYFNDGDTCTFGVGEWTVHRAVEDATDEDGDYVDLSGRCLYHELTGRSWEPGYEERVAARSADDVAFIADFEALLAACSEELLLAVLGDHVQVVATADGFTVEDYDHE